MFALSTSICFLGVALMAKSYLCESGPSTDMSLHDLQHWFHHGFELQISHRLTPFATHAPERDTRCDVACLTLRELTPTFGCGDHDRQA